MQTTLNKIKQHTPCEDGWNKLLNYLNKTEADDEVLELRTILESNGLDDTIWAFRAVECKDKEIRLFAADCAEMVLPIYEKKYPNDDRPRKAIQAARDYVNGLISAKKLDAAIAMRAAATAARAAKSDAWAEGAEIAEWVVAQIAAMAAMAALDANGTSAWAAGAAKEAARVLTWAAGGKTWVVSDAAWAEIKPLLLKYI